MVIKMKFFLIGLTVFSFLLAGCGGGGGGENSDSNVRTEVDNTTTIPPLSSMESEPTDLVKEGIVEFTNNEEQQVLKEVNIYLESVGFYNKFDISSNDIETNLKEFEYIDAAICELAYCTIILTTGLERQFFRTISN